MKKFTIFVAILLTVALAAGCVWFFLFREVDPCKDGHSFGEWEVTEKPTCGTTGKQMRTCSACGTVEEEAVPTTGNHRVTDWVTTIAATMTEAGERAKTCEKCARIVETQAVSPIGETIAVNASGEKRTVTLTGYEILYDDAVTHALYISTLNDLREHIERISGAALSLVPQTDRFTDTDAPEILVGETNRAETAAALERIEGEGFIIEVADNKIVIVGTTPLQTICAIQHFIRNYTSGTPADTTLVLDSSCRANNTKQVTLLDEQGTQFDLVFDQNLDNDPSHPYVASSTSDSRDYPCVATEALANSIAAMLSLESSPFEVRSDKDLADLEVLIGTMQRPESLYFQTLLDGNEYGIMVKDSKILLLAWNDYALQVCLQEFESLLALCQTTVDGVETIALPNGFYATGVATEAWRVDFPRPAGEGITLNATQNVHDNSLQFVYTGDGVNADAYNAYCSTLLSSGYTVLTSNSIEGSIFKTFVNRANGLSLYVAYNDYKHEEEFATDDEFNRDYLKCIRIVSSPLDSVTLPDEGLLTQNPAYEKITDTTITALSFSGKAVGMGYVIMLEDGRFVVIDGGGVNSGGSEHENLWNVLVSMYEQAHNGQAPSSSDPIHIAAWLNTHSHWDHYYAFFQMLLYHGQSGLLKMDYLLGNFPAETSIYSVKGSTLEMSKATTLQLLKDRVIGGFEYVKVHTGQKFYLANLEIEIMMTYEDHLPRRIDNSNDTCTITRMTFKNSEAASSEKPITAVFLADAFRFQSRFLCAMYGSYLESDIVQLAHHGNIGCEQAVYDAIQPRVVLFPHTTDTFLKYTAGTSSTWNYKVDYYVVHKLSTVDYVYVAQVGTYLTLTLSPTGPDFDGIYDAITGDAIVYDNVAFIKKD